MTDRGEPRATIVATAADRSALEPARLVELAGQVDWIEVRADLVGDVDPAPLRAHFPGRWLYTLRSRAEGGAAGGPREARRRRIEAMAPRYDLVDLEADRDLQPGLLDAVRAEQRIISWHGPAADLAALRGRFDHMSRTPARLYKIVPTAEASGEELAPLVLLHSLGRHDLIAFAGGATGSWTRLVAPRLGAPVVYAGIGRAAAPGQPTVERLLSDFGLPGLPPVERLFGVVGERALGSLSPRLHNAAYRALGIPALYLPFEVPQFGEFWLEVVEPATLSILALPLEGLSVTTPHKDVAFAIAGATSPLANRLQAVNTLTRRDGVWEGESTDAEGVVGALAARGIDPRGRRAAVFGCGGAGRAAALGLAQAGATVEFVHRGSERGLAAARTLSLPFVLTVDFDPGVPDLLVNATPLGHAVPDELPFPVDRLRPDAVVVDLVYGEAPTALVAAARRRGLTAIDGREVLLAQAIPQFRAMTGRELPVDLGRRVLGLGE